MIVNSPRLILSETDTDTAATIEIGISAYDWKVICTITISSMLTSALMIVKSIDAVQLADDADRALEPEVVGALDLGVVHRR